MKLLRLGCVLCWIASGVLGQTPDVGSGAPNETIRQRFVQAWYRNGFNLLVTPTPLGDVRRLGTTGLVQEFQSVASSSLKLALIKANTSTTLPAEDAIDVFQVQAAMYSYFTSVGVTTAGYPTMDTANCPPLADNSCQYQLFDRSYALFTYSKNTFNGQTFTVRNPYYTKWSSLGGISALGPANSPETGLTSASNAAFTVQTFSQGAIYNITSGPLSGRLLAVVQPVWDLYNLNGANAGFLGLPTTEDLLLPDGRHRQTFENGAIEYTSGSAPALRLAVSSVVVNARTPLRMNLGDTLTLQASITAANGQELTDRTVSWTTSNGRVVTIQANGATAVLRALGGGTANVSAVSEGKSSGPITVFVTAPCCQAGEGAPTLIAQQAFQDAITRNRLNVKLPTASPVQRVGFGYVQEFVDAGPSPARYLIALSDRTSVAYVLAGAILARYEALGGPAGSLGYPASDASPGGRQLFENSAALAGSPVVLVTGALLAKWAVLGYETGVAGPPVGDPAPFLSFNATTGSSQTFRDGVLFAIGTGAQAGKVYLVGGLILARYIALGGAGGKLGVPVTDEFGSAGKQRQEFEGGFIEYAPGDAEAREIEKERRPSVSVSPTTVIAGSRIRLAAGGFQPGATLRVSITGQADFLVRTQTGAYVWETYVSPAAASGSVTVRAVDASNSAAAAQASYTVRTPREAAPTLAMMRGNAQTGAPRALLPLPLRVALRDDAGNPIAGASVRFTASSSAQVAPASAVTDERGEAEAALRLPPAEGITLVNAEAAGQIVTFNARAAASALAAFPKLTQTADQGALVAAAASIVRYHQNRSELASPNGLADPAVLGQFLKSFCIFDPQGAQICDGYVEQVPNLWRVGAFVAGGIDVSVEKPDEAAVRDLVSQGSPVLMALSLKTGGAHFVVATGVGADGSVQIHDPNPALGRTLLSQYLGSDGTLASALRLLPRAPSGTGFLVASASASLDVTSVAGACGATAEISGVRFRYCDGTQSLYQLDLSGDGTYKAVVTDLSNQAGRIEIQGFGATSYKLTRPALQWTVAPQETSFAAKSVLNAASFTPDLAPGAIAAIFGAGLARATVEVDDRTAPVLFSSPFQVNAQIPLETGPGMHTLRVRSPYGVAEQPIQVNETAPAIFVMSNQRGAVVNQDGSINAPTSPARRGQVIVIYGTGLGAVTPQGSLRVTQKPVTGVLAGQELPVAFAGLTPGFIGLYQVNLPLPAATPPGLDLPLVLRQGGVEGNVVGLAVQ